MPEACLTGYDNKSSTRETKIDQVVASDDSKRHLNWNRSNSIDVTYIPLVNRRQYAAAPPPATVSSVVITSQLPQPNQARLTPPSTASTRSRFCCCARNSDELNSCWKLKRKQIIWESSHASAKNRTTATIGTTQTTTTTATTPLTTASVAPTTQGAAWTGTTWYSSKSGCSHVRYVEPSEVGGEQYCSNRVRKISTSLPATPNLSQLRRRQYRKLSYTRGTEEEEEEEEEEADVRVETLRQQRLRQQLQMSATKLQTLQQQQQQQQQQQTLEAFMESGIKVLTTAEIATNNNNNNNNNVLLHELKRTLSGSPTTSTQTQTDFTLLGHSQNVGGSNAHTAMLPPSLMPATTSIQTQTVLPPTPTSALPPTDNATAVAVAKSSLSFCEHCCESASVVSATARHTAVRDSGRYYRAHTDSVSDLASYRFVSDEDETSSATRHNADTDEAPEQHQQQQQQQQVGGPAEEQSAVNKQSRAHAANRSCVSPTRSPPLHQQQLATSSSPTICCYTIDRSAAGSHYKATTVLEHGAKANVTVTAPVPIPNGKRRDVPSSPELSERSLENLLSTSLPSEGTFEFGWPTRNVGVRQSLRTQRRIPQPVPPPVPPKPRHNVAGDSVPATTLSQDLELESHSRSVRNDYYGFTLADPCPERPSYDPNSFQRKVQRFEKQNTLLGRSFYAASLPNASLTDTSSQSVTSLSASNGTPACSSVANQTRSLERSISPEHCELLSCFGTVKNTHSVASAKHNNNNNNNEAHENDDDAQHNVDNDNNNDDENENGVARAAAQRDFVARSLSDSSCCSASLIANEKCAINNKNNLCQHSSNNNNDHDSNNKCGGGGGGQNNAVGHVKSAVNHNKSAKSASGAPPPNRNYNCKFKARQLQRQARPYASEQQLPTGIASPLLPRRTLLRYDSYGRLKSERVSHLPTVASARKSASASAPQNAAKSDYAFASNSATTAAGPLHSNALGKLTPTLCRKLNYLSDKVEECPVVGIEEEIEEEEEEEEEYGVETTPLSVVQYRSDNTTNATVVPSSPTTLLGAQQQSPPLDYDNHAYTFQGELDDLNLPPPPLPADQQLFKSFSDSSNFVPASAALPPQHASPLCFSDFSLKSHFPNSDSSISCKCAGQHHNSPTSPTSPTSLTSPTSPTSPLSSAPLGLNQKNSHSLPSVQRSANGAQSPIWLSSETIESRFSDHNRYLDEVQSNCSDQTTIFHLENDCALSATSSTPSTQSGGNNVLLRGPLILKRIPAIQSFGYIPTHSSSLGSANVREIDEKEISNMEKRRNTLDRFQRLGFGRKSSPSTAAAAAPAPVQPENSGSSTRGRKSTDKSERLKELTELLRGNRSSPTPPPVPPPRKPRNGSQSASNSFERSDTPITIGSSVDSTPLSFMSNRSDDILLMDQDEPAADTKSTGTDLAARNSSSSSSTSPRSTVAGGAGSAATRLYDMLKPNTSMSNFEALMLAREKSKSPPPVLGADADLPCSSDADTKLARPEARTVIGSYTQKGIPYRSASFSQSDVSSGKYKKSSWSALRDRLRRDKSTETNSSATAKKKEEEERAAEASRKAKSEPDWIYIPLKKKTEMSINLNLTKGQESNKGLENVMESPDMIPEEDIFTTDTEQSYSSAVESKELRAVNMAVAHAKMESLTDTIQSENDYTIEEQHLPVTVDSQSLLEAASEMLKPIINSALLVTDETSDTDGSPKSAQESLQPLGANLATLVEEQIPLESPPDNFLQTATTCLIPVPVYECAAQDWRLENPPQEWVEVAPEEFGIIPETIEPLVALGKCEVAEAEIKTEEEYRKDIVPTISVSRSSEEADDKSLLRRKEDMLTRAKETVELRQNSLDYPEVKKRYSHDDMEIGIEKRSSLDSIATRHSADERKRIDKSKRRKGMYIDNADWTPATAVAPHGRDGLALDISAANFNVIKPDSPEECSIMYLNSPPTDDNRTPGSLYSLDTLNTPESECNKAPVWTKAERLTSFSLQSSEEKDDSTCESSSIVGLKRQNQSYPFLRTDSISDNECDRMPLMAHERTSPSPASSEYDIKRFSKRPLRGPYGQMLEAEMKKPNNKMHFEEILEDLRESDVTLQPRRQRAVHDDAGSVRNLPHHSNSMRVRKTNTYLPVPAHARAASTPSQIENVSKSGGGSIDKINPHEKRYQSSLDNSVREKDSVVSSAGSSHHHHHQRDMKRAASEAPISKGHHNKRSQSMGGEKLSPGQQIVHQQKRSLDANANAKAKGAAGANIMPSQELLAELLKGSSEKLLSEQRQQMCADTRTHVVQEIFRNEQSYVESLQTVVTKYLKVLKSPEHAGMIDSRTVDEIFFMVPDILEIHEKFLSEMRSRLDNWDAMQKVGDAFMETFSKLEVLEVYTSFVNNCNRAKNAIRSTKHQRPSFAKFLETTAREHKGKLTLDNLLIKPVQKFPNYEMLFQRLIKHTDHDHPDQKHLQDVLKLVHDILVHINCKEREILENGQREATLRELEGVIEGITDLIAPERQFLLFDLVSMPSGQGARKERGFFLFNDLLVLTSIKKRSGTIRKPNTSTCPGTVASTLDTNKYKFLTKISLDCLEIVKTKDENLKRIMNEIENLAEDCNKLQQIADICSSLKYRHQYLEDNVRELHRDVQRQLSERQTNDAQLNMLELTVSSPNGSQKLSIVFSKAEKRTQWEETFNEAKQKLAATLERHPIPEFLMSIPIRKTRAGLQFTCAAATLSEKRDVWVCNSDGYVGQVCIMSLHPEPNVTSCNGVCNARILCVASVPAFSGSSSSISSTTTATITATITAPEPPRSASAPTHQSYTQQLRDYRKSISPNCQPTTVIGTPEKKKTPSGSSAAGAANNTNANNNVGGSNNNSDIQLELNLSSSDDEADAAGSNAAAGAGSGTTERIPSPAPSTHTTGSTSTASTAIVGSGGTPHHHGHQDSNPEDSDINQSTMWIGTEDGCIHVYNSTDNIRIKKNRIKIEHHSAVYSILYLDNRVFVSLANGDICVYLRDGAVWNTSSSHCLSIGTVTSPVTKLLNVHGKLWCSIQGIIKVLDIETLLVVNQLQISSDSKPITNMTVSNNYVWISIQNSAHIKCFHSNSHQLITEVNLAPAVNKMLSNCDEIIRQHKAACLRVTSLLSCKDLIWIGTSAGVLLTIPAQGYEKGAPNVVPTGIPHGHTGHVRFLTFVETTGVSGTGSTGSESSSANSSSSTAAARDGGDSLTAANDYKNQSGAKVAKPKHETNNILIISGGDGYEDFRNSGANSLSEIAGREDSTNHLLIWQI